MEFLVLKATHIIAVISWMAALLYLPRLFVYHVLNGKNEEIHKMFCLMEKRLISIIMGPAMVITIITGVIILYLETAYISFWWMHIKLICVVILIITHRYFISLHNGFVKRQNKKDHDFFRKINELPTILMILIVFCIVLKP